MSPPTPDPDPDPDPDPEPSETHVTIIVSDDIVEHGTASVDDCYIQVTDTVTGSPIAEYVGTDMIGTHYVIWPDEHQLVFWLICNQGVTFESVDPSNIWNGNGDAAKYKYLTYNGNNQTVQINQVVLTK